MGAAEVPAAPVAQQLPTFRIGEYGTLLSVRRDLRGSHWIVMHGDRRVMGEAATAVGAVGVALEAVATMGPLTERLLLSHGCIRPLR